MTGPVDGPRGEAAGIAMPRLAVVFNPTAGARKARRLAAALSILR